jgi:ABC-type transport system involved in cytochrome c biogenesis permease subunit
MTLRSVWFALQAAGFACVTVAALLELKALLNRQATLDGAPLHWTRAGFLLLGAALVAGGMQGWRREGEHWPLRPGHLWGLLAWLVVFAVLHVHRVKAFKGRPEVFAGLAGWALAAGAWFLLR